MGASVFNNYDDLYDWVLAFYFKARKHRYSVGLDDNFEYLVTTSWEGFAIGFIDSHFYCIFDDMPCDLSSSDFKPEMFPLTVEHFLNAY